MPSTNSSRMSRFHSALAVGHRCAGQVGSFGSGFGSRAFKGRLPGLPATSLRRVGFGLRPRMTGLLVRRADKSIRLVLARPAHQDGVGAVHGPEMGHDDPALALVSGHLVMRDKAEPA